MLKGLNVINLFLVIFLTIVLRLPAQNKISGNYVFIDGTGYYFEKYSFNDKGVFDYQKGGDLGVMLFGKGHYLIRNDSIVLNYDLSRLEDNSYHKFHTYVNSSESINLKIKVFDIDKKPISGVSVYNTKGKYGSLTNNEGLVHLKFKKGHEQLKIEVSNICCGNYSFYINTNLNYNISVYLSESLNNPQAIKNEIRKYKILKLDDLQLKLKNKDQVLVFKKQQ